MTGREACAFPFLIIATFLCIPSVIFRARAANKELGRCVTEISFSPLNTAVLSIRPGAFPSSRVESSRVAGERPIRARYTRPAPGIIHVLARLARIDPAHLAILSPPATDAGAHKAPITSDEHSKKNKTKKKRIFTFRGASAIPFDGVALPHFSRCARFQNKRTLSSVSN